MQKRSVKFLLNNCGIQTTLSTLRCRAGVFTSVKGVETDSVLDEKIPRFVDDLCFSEGHSDGQTSAGVGVENRRFCGTVFLRHHVGDSVRAQEQRIPCVGLDAGYYAGKNWKDLNSWKGIAQFSRF